MENFVLVGKAKTVFRLLELKAQQQAKEQARRPAGKPDGKKAR
jgi:hypothetical protein